MAQTGVHSLERSLQKTNEWITELDEAFGWDDRQRSYRALRAVLHGLRDRLQVDEAAELAAQLPLTIKGVFFDGWDPSKTPVKIRTREAFLGRVVEEFGDAGISAPAEMVTTVFAQLGRRVADGEIEDVRTSLPESIRELWPVD